MNIIKRKVYALYIYVFSTDLYLESSDTVQVTYDILKTLLFGLTKYGWIDVLLLLSYDLLSKKVTHCLKVWLYIIGISDKRKSLHGVRQSLE